MKESIVFFSVQFFQVPHIHSFIQIGKPLYTADGEPLYYEGDDAEQSFVQIKGGTKIARNEYLKDQESKLNLKEGSRINLRDQDSKLNLKEEK